MRIQGHLRDHPLPDLLTILSNRHESGCLRVEFEPEPAFFYFKDGQLVDARMSFLKGFAAVHLAFSRAKAAYDFDNAVEPPQTAISDENERLLLSGILGVRLSVNAEVETPTQLAAENPDCDANQITASSNEDSLSSQTESQSLLEPTSNVIMSAVLASTLPAQTLQPAARWGQTRPPRTRPANPIQIVLRWRPAFRYLTREKLIRTAAVIVVLAIPVTVGITVRLGKREAAGPVLAVVTQPPVEQSASQAPVATQAADTNVSLKETIVPPAPVASSSPLARSSARETKPEQSKVSRETVREPTALAPNESKADQVSKTILVQVRVEQGRVIEAWVNNSHKGLEAYEATAIRLARQRRYSADTARTESVPVDVSVKK